MTAERARSTTPDFEALLHYIKDERGFDFTGYKRSTLQRRIQKRMQMVDENDSESYRIYLEANPGEFTELFNTILINVTSFFRDPEAWDYVAAEVIPQALEGKGAADPIRVWSAGSAAGQEAYSLAMLLCEAIGEERFRSHVKIYATDLDNDALAQARHGNYTEEELRPAVSDERLERFFERSNHGWTFRPDRRRAVIFGRHDLMQDPPISRIDLLVCRNTLMYFTSETQRRILANLHFALSPSGMLFLGKAEAIASRSNLFQSVDQRWHVYRRTNANARPEHGQAPAVAADDDGLVAVLQRASFEAAPVAQIVVANDGILTQANARARSLFGITLTHVGVPLKDLELSYRPVDLRSAIDEVLNTGQPLALGEAEWRVAGGDITHLSIELVPLRPGGSVRGVSVSFTEVTRFRLLERDFERTQRELETAYEELQSTVEELETTNEELQSTNEELETTNEELHSTNEELETMNEELHSTNEEMETTNVELRERTSALDGANAFLASILGSMESGIVVLDSELHVRRWNRAAEELWGLRAEEVEGQHFLNLDFGLPTQELRNTIRSALGGDETEPRTLAAVNRRGRAVQVQVVASTLRADGDEVDGAILRMDVVSS